MISRHTFAHDNVTYLCDLRDSSRCAGPETNKGRNIYIHIYTYVLPGTLSTQVPAYFFQVNLMQSHGWAFERVHRRVSAM